MSNYVFVIDTNKKPCNPVHPGTARHLLKSGQAAVFRRYPFTLILKTESVEPVREIQLKIDPGSKTTGIALTQGSNVIFGAELTHRGQAIKASLESRSAIRRGRRNRHTRYRKARCLNRSRTDGRLAPSLKHRVVSTLTWVNKLIKFAPITGISQELVRFDLQQIENPEISGTEYQQGALQRHCSRTKFHFGFQTGDIVRAVVKSGKKVGTHVGRIATRATGSFNISTTKGLVEGISYRYCKAIHKKDGYGY